MLFTASTVFSDVTKIENTDYIIGNISTFNFPATHSFIVGEAVTGTGAYATAGGVVYDVTSTIAKVARTSTLDFSTTILNLTNGAITASYSSVSATYGIINDSIQRLYNRDAWLRENAAILSENETVSGSWTFSGTINSATITNLKGTTASFSGTSTLSTLISTNATITNLKGTSATITNLYGTSLIYGTTKLIDGRLSIDTSDGADNGSLYITGGGSAGVSRGSYVVVSGNESINGGDLFLVAGSISGASVHLRTGNAVDRLVIDSAGNSQFTGPLVVDGGLTVNGDTIVLGDTDTATSIVMTDSDHGNRSIFCDTNRIGFLRQDGAWGSYCDDNGVWNSDGGFSINGSNLGLDKFLSTNMNLVDPAGYYTLPGGLIIKWGYLSIGDISGVPTGTVTYSAGQGGAFPFANIGTVQGHYGNCVGTSFWVTSKTVNGFSWAANESDSNTQSFNVFYISIGV